MRRFTRNMAKARGLGGSGERGGVGASPRVVLAMVPHEDSVGEGMPIDAVAGEIVRIGVVRQVKTAGAFSDHAKHEHLTRTGRGRATHVETMGIPGLRPLLGVLVDGVEEEVM